MSTINCDTGRSPRSTWSFVGLGWYSTAYSNSFIVMALSLVEKFRAHRERRMLLGAPRANPERGPLRIFQRATAHATHAAPLHVRRLHRFALLSRSNSS